jgi:hypothetical protein
MDTTPQQRSGEKSGLASEAAALGANVTVIMNTSTKVGSLAPPLHFSSAILKPLA